MATFKAIVFNGGRHLKKDGTTNVKIRLYHNSSAQYLPTEYFIQPEEMQEDGQISAYLPQSEELNYEITCLIQQYRGAYIKLGTARTQKMTCSQLKEELLRLLAPGSEVIDFVAFANGVIAKTVKRKTRDWYQSSLNSFIEFAGKKVDIRDIRVKTLEEYITYLFSRNVQRTSYKKVKNKVGKIVTTKETVSKPMEPGTINNYIRGLRALYNKAKKEYNNEDIDIIRIPNIPFTKISIPEYQRKRKNLTIEDIIKIRDSKFERDRTNMARDVFMMLFYLMGVNMYDFFSIITKKENRITYERSKMTTIDNKKKIPLSIKIEPELAPLLDFYSNGTFLSHFRMRYTDYNNFLKAVNKELKVIAKELKIDVTLSTNWARHSWASIARNKANIAKADVDFCLGHVNNDYKMADIYIEIDYGICDRANRAVLDLLKNKSEKK